ncbi:hypothetical protein BJ944DRAFT_250150 [Cunninghamella echinulata]|nr:hypothetical protein BJ944DRAFT_250150 [Cunninghamella echinulata]
MAHNIPLVESNYDIHCLQKMEPKTITLVVKHIPSVLSSSLEDLQTFFMKHGAIRVRPMQSKQMKGMAFLDFKDYQTASKALETLKNYKFDTTHKGLRIEFAKNRLAKSTKDNSLTTTTADSKTKNQSLKRDPVPIAESLGINYPPNPQLKYKYPDPTPEIISNMMNSIATIPRLYNQVLHLMNKMNLPPPFGPQETLSVPSILKRKHDDLLESGESEIESEEDNESEKKIRLRRMALEKQKQILRNKGSK